MQQWDERLLEVRLVITNILIFAVGFDDDHSALEIDEE